VTGWKINGREDPPYIAIEVASIFILNDLLEGEAN
jgi:hypothetical protein